MTLKALYAEITGDQTTHQRTIDAHFRKLDTNRRTRIRMRCAGSSYHQIAATEGTHAASVRDSIVRAMERIRKAAAGEPRYNHVGRKHLG